MVRSSIAIVLVACSSPSSPPQPLNASPPPASGTLEVPFALAPVIDGVIDVKEWADAMVVPLEPGVTLRFMHDRALVYIAVDRTEPMGFGCVLIAEPQTVHVLHASMKLGSAAYVATARGTFDPKSKDYAWREREAMLKEEGWLATATKMDAPPDQEFAITFARLGLPDHARPIAISLFHSKPDAKDIAEARTFVWPRGLADGVANVELVAGFNPDAMRFEPQRWITLVPR